MNYSFTAFPNLFYSGQASVTEREQNSRHSLSLRATTLESRPVDTSQPLSSSNSQAIAL
jgi:hypothetical protein